MLWRPHSGFGTTERRLVLSLRPPATPNHTAAQALSLVKRIYAPYARSDTTTPLLGNCFFDPPTGRPCAGPVTDYVTPELAGELRLRANEGTGSDPMDCAQNTPGAITFGTPQVRGSEATIVVQEVYSVSGHNPITVTLDLGSLKLTDVRCDRRLEPL